MARIAGVDLPGYKVAEIALTKIYGIGRETARQVLSKLNIPYHKRIKDLLDSEVSQLRDIIEKEYKVEGELRTEIRFNIKRLMDIGCYRGIRHRLGLPLRGQSTKTNARTHKGKKRTVANKKK
jgi:small subunit ribosomal protein S13